VGGRKGVYRAIRALADVAGRYRDPPLAELAGLPNAIVTDIFYRILSMTLLGDPGATRWCCNAKGAASGRWTTQR